MKIENIIIKNFKNVSQIEVSFDSNITYLVGRNGSGKSSIIDALLVAFKGKNALPKSNRWQMIKNGSEKSVIIAKLTDQDNEIKITRKITDKNVYLEIESSDGKKLGQDFLNEIFNDFTISPKAFAKKSPQEQALLLGIDTSEFDGKIKKIYDERTLVGREKSKLQGAVDNYGNIVKVEEVKLTDLFQEKDEIRAYNEEQEKAKEFKQGLEKLIDENLKDITNENSEIKKLEQKIKECKERQKESEQRIQTYNKEIEENIKILPLKSFDEIDKKIEDAESTNQKAKVYEQYKKDNDALQEKTKEYTHLTNNIKQIETAKKEYVKDSKLPFSDMTIDEEGGLKIKNKPFNDNFFSTGEIWKIAVQLLIAMDPKLKIVFVNEANLLDEENLEIIKGLTDKGYHFVFELVGSKKVDGNCILLKESEVVESIEEEPTAEEAML